MICFKRRSRTAAHNWTLSGARTFLPPRVGSFYTSFDFLARRARLDRDFSSARLAGKERKDTRFSPSRALHSSRRWRVRRRVTHHPCVACLRRLLLLRLLSIVDSGSKATFVEGARDRSRLSSSSRGAPVPKLPPRGSRRFSAPSDFFFLSILTLVRTASEEKGGFVSDVAVLRSKTCRDVRASPRLARRERTFLRTRVRARRARVSTVFSPSLTAVRPSSPGRGGDCSLTDFLYVWIFYG